MLQPLREVELARNAARRSAGELAQLRLVPRLASAEEEELCVEREVVVVSEDEVEPLLVREARAHREDRNGRPLLEPERALQRRLALLLHVERLGGVVRRDLLVGGGVPHA